MRERGREERGREKRERGREKRGGEKRERGGEKGGGGRRGRGGERREEREEGGIDEREGRKLWIIKQKPVVLISDHNTTTTHTTRCYRYAMPLINVGVVQLTPTLAG